MGNALEQCCTPVLGDNTNVQPVKTKSGIRNRGLEEETTDGDWEDVRVVLSKTNDAQRFGFVNIADEKNRRLMITEVSEHGLLADWNASRDYGAKIVKGSHLRAVNGIEDIVAMRSQLVTKKTVSLHFRVPVYQAHDLSYTTSQI